MSANPGTTNLISWWSLDEASGTRVDSHGANNLADNNTVGSAAGKVNNGADFESANSEYLSSADNPSLSLGVDTDFSFGFWWKPESLAAGQTIIYKGVGGTTSIEYRIATFDAAPTIMKLAVSDGTTTTVVEDIAALSVGAWHFFVMRHDKAANELSIQRNNGTPITLAHSAGTQDLAGELNLGAFNAGSGVYADGVLDEVFFYKDRVITINESTFLYNSGSGRSYSELLGSSLGNMLMVF